MDYILADIALMKQLSDIFVDKNDIGSSDYYLVWFELGRDFGRSRERQGAFCINGK